MKTALKKPPLYLFLYNIPIFISIFMLFFLMSHFIFSSLLSFLLLFCIAYFLLSNALAKQSTLSFTGTLASLENLPINQKSSAKRSYITVFLQSKKLYSQIFLASLPFLLFVFAVVPLHVSALIFPAYIPYQKITISLLPLFIGSASFLTLLLILLFQFYYLETDSTGQLSSALSVLYPQRYYLSGAMDLFAGIAFQLFFVLTMGFVQLYLLFKLLAFLQLPFLKGQNALFLGISLLSFSLLYTQGFKRFLLQKRFGGYVFGQRYLYISCFAFIFFFSIQYLLVRLLSSQYWLGASVGQPVILPYLSNKTVWIFGEWAYILLLTPFLASLWVRWQLTPLYLKEAKIAAKRLRFSYFLQPHRVELFVFFFAQFGFLYCFYYFFIPNKLFGILIFLIYFGGTLVGFLAIKDRAFTRLLFLPNKNKLKTNLNLQFLYPTIQSLFLFPILYAFLGVYTSYLLCYIFVLPVLCMVFIAFLMTMIKEWKGYARKR